MQEGNPQGLQEVRPRQSSEAMQVRVPQREEEGMTIEKVRIGAGCSEEDRLALEKIAKDLIENKSGDLRPKFPCEEDDADPVYPCIDCTVWLIHHKCPIEANE